MEPKGLVSVVDSTPEVRGSGVVLRRGSAMRRLRQTPPGGTTVVFELHERQLRQAYLQSIRERRGPYKDNPSFSTETGRPPGWSVRGDPTRDVHVPPAALTRRPGASVAKRGGGSSVGDEWRGLGLNCAGAVIGWIGVVGTGALVPVSGGVTGFATAALYAGAIAGTGQCLASVYRVNNATHGRADRNERLDNSRLYRWTMLGADGVGLYGAAGGLKVAAATARTLGRAGVSAGDLAARATVRAVRADLAAGMGLAVARPGTRVLNRVVRQRLLDGAAGVLGVISSADGGIIRELIVWVVQEG